MSHGSRASRTVTVEGLARVEGEGSLRVEVRDEGTRDYWTRVNYSTVVPPGKSTLIIPVKPTFRTSPVEYLRIACHRQATCPDQLS